MKNKRIENGICVIAAGIFMMILIAGLEWFPTPLSEAWDNLIRTLADAIVMLIS